MAVQAGIAVPRGRRRFWIGMALAIAATAFAGFSRTYYLKSFYDSAPLSGLLHLHGVVFTGWILLLVAQTSLVGMRRTDLHRRLGVGGAVLAALVVLVGTTTAIVRVREGAAPPNVPPLAFLAVPLFDMLLFAALRDPACGSAATPRPTSASSRSPRSRCWLRRSPGCPSVLP